MRRLDLEKMKNQTEKETFIIFAYAFLILKIQIKNSNFYFSIIFFCFFTD